jgi:hypothetical protein
MSESSDLKRRPAIHVAESLRDSVAGSEKQHVAGAWLRDAVPLTVPQVAEVMGVSTSTVDNYWAYSRTWLRMELSPEGARPGDKRKS